MGNPGLDGGSPKQTAITSMRRFHRRSRPENEVQRTVIEHLKIRGKPGMLYWHTPNGGKRLPIEAAVMKGLGVRAGVADLLFLDDGKLYSLELKAMGRRSTEAQIQWRLDVNRCGGFASEAAGIDEALRILEAWQLLRGVAA